MTRETRTGGKRRRFSPWVYKTVVGAVTGTIAYAATLLISEYQYYKLPMDNYGKTVIEGFKRYDFDKPELPAEKEEERYRNIIENGIVQTNSYGHRTGKSDPEYTEKKPGDECRIICLGESTTWGDGVKPEEAYPLQLEKYLSQEYPNKKIRVMNVGRRGRAIEYITKAYTKNHQIFEADIVILLLGINDATKVVYGIQGEDPLLKINKKPKGWQVDLIRNDWIGPIYSYIYASILDKDSELAKIGEKTRKAMEDDNEVKRYIEVAREYPQEFHDNLEELVRTAQANGSKVLLIPIPRNPYDRGEEKWEKNLTKVHSIAVKSNWRAIKDVAEEQGVYYLEIDPLSIPEENF